MAIAGGHCKRLKLRVRSTGRKTDKKDPERFKRFPLHAIVLSLASCHYLETTQALRASLQDIPKNNEGEKDFGPAGRGEKYSQTQ